MAELIDPHPLGKGGHFPNTQNTVLELHRLLSIFLASKSFAELCTHFPGEGFDPIYKIQEVETDEITRILLTLAITARVIDDREDREFRFLSSDCGTLRKNMNEQDEELLSIREACNKIIHAKNVNFDVEEFGVHRYLKPYIYLYGTQKAMHWRVQLDVVKFCKEYARTVSHL